MNPIIGILLFLAFISLLVIVCISDKQREENERELRRRGILL